MLPKVLAPSGSDDFSRSYSTPQNPPAPSPQPPLPRMQLFSPVDGAGGEGGWAYRGGKAGLRPALPPRPAIHPAEKTTHIIILVGLYTEGISAVSSLYTKQRVCLRQPALPLNKQVERTSG